MSEKEIKANRSGLRHRRSPSSDDEGALPYLDISKQRALSMFIKADD